MGVNDFFQFLKKKSPNSIEVIENLNVTPQTILGIDMPVLLHISKSHDVNNETGYIYYIIERLLWLKKLNIKIIFVFDGEKNYLKDEENKKRSEARMKNQQKSLNYINDLKEIQTHVSDLKETIIQKNKEKIELKDSELELKENEIEKLEEILGNKIVEQQILEENIIKHKKMAIQITKEDIQTVMKILDIFKFNYLFAHDEGEKLLVRLQKKKIITDIVSEDSDCVFFGCDSFIRNFWAFYYKSLNLEIKKNPEKIISNFIFSSRIKCCNYRPSWVTLTFN